MRSLQEELPEKMHRMRKAPGLRPILTRPGAGKGFLKRNMIMTGLTLLLLSEAAVFSACAETEKSYSRTGLSMGTVFTVSLTGPGEDPTETLLATGDRLEQEILSYRIPDSEIGRINAGAGDPEGVPLSEGTEKLLTECLKLSEESGGAFDITIGALTRLWNIDESVSGDQAFRVPEQAEIDEALRHCGHEKVRIGEHRIYLPEGMSLDLGAVGKGIYLDTCEGELPEGCRGTISAGGSILTAGEKENGKPWRIGIRDPFGGDEVYETLEVPGDMKISTSGDYERFIEKDGIRYHHILDPETGYPAGFPGLSAIASVTVVSESGFLSDALSTACFVLGEEEGERLAGRYGAKVLFIRRDGSMGGSLSDQPDSR